MSIVRNFNLYLNAGNGSAPYINVSQYDQGEQWVFTLYKEDGTKYTPSTGAIIGIKADNRGIINTGTVDADGRVVINETQQMTAASGRAIYELLIDNATHGTANFIVNVERRPSDDAEFSDSDLSMLQEAIDSAAEIEDLLDGQDVPTVITPIISDWLDENITNPSNPPIDTSLTVAGAAADAKKTGDEISDLKSALSDLCDLNMLPTNLPWEDGDLDANGQDSEYANFKRSDGYIDAIPMSIEMNGATRIYICYYKADYTFISKINTNTDITISPSDVSNCAYYRFATKDTNLSLLVFKTYPEITETIQKLVIENSQVFKKISVDISNIYDRAGIVSSTGKLMQYSDGSRSRRRTVKYLQVAEGEQTIKATYANGTLHIFEYTADKTFVDWHNLNNNTPRKLGSTTRWVRFEHVSYTGGSVIVEYPSITNQPYWSYGLRESGNTIPFVYQVHPCRGTDIPDTVTTLSTDDVFTSGLLMLPPNYTEDGDKVPVIYFAHGSSDYLDITATEFSTNYMTYLHYLRDEGYAVFDCYGWTNLYIISGAQMANPTNMAAIKQGLEWAANAYNIDISKVYVTGKSLGGLQAINMCYEGDFPIKACCPLAPALDSAEIGFGYDVASRKAYCADLCFSEDTNNVLDEVWSGNLSSASADYKAYALANADKLLGYNPIYRNLIGVNATEFVQYEIDGQGGTGSGQDLPNKLRTMSRICTIPTKIIMAVDDNAVAPSQCSSYIQSIKNAGGVAEMRWLPANTGKHHAVDTSADAIKVASITTKCGVTYTNLPIAYADMVQFFRRYS